MITFASLLFYNACVSVAGVPAAAVALGFAGSVKAFDGKYDDCVFR